MGAARPHGRTLPPGYTVTRPRGVAVVVVLLGVAGVAAAAPRGAEGGAERKSGGAALSRVVIASMDLLYRGVRSPKPNPMRWLPVGVPLVAVPLCPILCLAAIRRHRRHHIQSTFLGAWGRGWAGLGGAVFPGGVDGARGAQRPVDCTSRCTPRPAPRPA